MKNKTLRTKVEAIKRQKIVSEKVVSLAEFRDLKKNVHEKTILVVDDDEIMRNGLKRILESSDYKVLLAEDGLELSRILESTSLDLVLLDVNLPWVDGLELCRLIKGSHTLKHVPLIFVSARKTEEDIKAGILAGADDYVTKPFDIDVILNTIQQVMLKKSS